MRVGVVAAALLAAACSSLDKPALETYDDIRAAIAVKTDASTGVTMASSEAAARVVTEFDHTRVGSMDESGLTTGAVGSTRSTQTVFVEGRRHGQGQTQVDIVRVESFQVARDAVGATARERSGKDLEGKVGSGWRTAYWRPTSFEHQCEQDRPYCIRRVIDRLALSQDDVRALLVENGREIVVAFTYWKSVDWRLDADELTAVLDALGSRDQFR